MSAANPPDPRSLWLNSSDALLQVLCCVAFCGHDASNFSSLTRAFRVDEVLWGCIKDRRGPRRRTALMACSITGDLTRVRWLLEQGADVNAAQMGNGITSLMLACGKGHLEVVRELLACGANANAQTTTCWNTLMSAFSSCYLDIVRDGGGVNSHFGKSPLMWACQNGHLDVVHELLGRGASVNTTPNGFKTPLMWACQSGHLEIVRVLLGQGANVNAAPTTDRWTVLTLACTQDKLEVVRELLERGANVNNAPHYFGMTALMAASMHGNLEMVRELLGRGADVSAAPGGTTSLLHAIMSKKINLEVVRELLRHGANVNERGSNGWSSLGHACLAGHLGLVRELLKQGGHVNAASLDGTTPLIASCREGHLEVTRLLLAHHANKAHLDHYGQSAYDRTPASNTELRALVKP
jgi:ankyrin repeat protein